MRNIDDIITDNIKLITTRDKDANKGSYGKLLVIGGSRGMSGATYLSSLAAFRTGIGMVKLLGPECNRIILQTALPEAMYQSMETADGSIDKAALISCIDWADMLSIGSGLSTGSEAVSLMQMLVSPDVSEHLATKELVIYDADALNIISYKHMEDIFRACPHTVITPHIGEMSRLSGVSISHIKEHRAELAAAYAAQHGISVVLKDAVTVVAAPSRETLTIDSGCGAMAKAGSGDVLCGFIAGITAVLKGNIADSIPTAVYLHGRAGCISAEKSGQHSILARDIANNAGAAISSCIRE